MRWTIYALADPDTPSDYRYVGGTTTALLYRLGNHVVSSKASYDRKSLWVKSLVSKGKMPAIICLETGDDLGWREKEKYWITRCTQEGHNLLNCQGKKTKDDRVAAERQLHSEMLLQPHSWQQVIEGEGQEFLNSSVPVALSRNVHTKTITEPKPIMDDPFLAFLKFPKPV